MTNIKRHVDDSNIGNSDAIFNEYIINNEDPEDSSYEWMYLEDLNADNNNLPHLL